MDRVGGFRWWLRGLLGRSGWSGYRSARVIQVPGPFWGRWWNMLRDPLPPLPGGFRPPAPAPPPPALPPWAGPPESELGVAVPLRTILLARPRVVVAVVDCVAYS